MTTRIGHQFLLQIPAVQVKEKKLDREKSKKKLTLKKLGISSDKIKIK